MCMSCRYTLAGLSPIWEPTPTHAPEKKLTVGCALGLFVVVHGYRCTAGSGLSITLCGVKNVELVRG